MKCSSGSFDMQGGSFGFGSSPLGVINNAGVFNKSGTGLGVISGWTFNNTGAVEAQGGTLSIHAYNQIVGNTVLSGGAFAFGITASASIQGGSLSGAGTITGSVNNSGGVVSPGASAGIIKLSGNYTQGDGGELNIEIGGPDPAQYDRLEVTGSSTLAGKLRVTLVNGYSPEPGTTFSVMTFPSDSRTGEFSELVGPASKRFSVAYDATSVILTALPPAPADLDGDGDVDHNDFAVFETCASGPGIPHSGGVTCQQADFDTDNDVDQSDFGALQRCYSGEGNPGDPSCVD